MMEKKLTDSIPVSVGSLEALRKMLNTAHCQQRMADNEVVLIQRQAERIGKSSWAKRRGSANEIIRLASAAVAHTNTAGDLISRISEVIDRILHEGGADKVVQKDDSK